MRRMWPYMSRYKGYLAISCFCVVAETIFELIVPIIMADIIDTGIANADKDRVLIRGAQIIACALIALVLGILYARYAAAAGQDFGAELKKDELTRVQSFSFASADHFSTSSLITRLTNDVTALQTTISNGARPTVRSPVILPTAPVLTFAINTQLAAIFLIIIPVLGIVLFVIVRRMRPLYRLIQTSVDKVNTIVQKNLSTIHVVKSYIHSTYEEEKFEEVNDSLRSASERTFRTSVWSLPLLQLVMYTMVVCIIWPGGNMIFAGTMGVGELTGFLSYVLQILNSLMMISSVFLILTGSITSGEHILEVLDGEMDTRGLPQVTASVQRGDIASGHMYFKYREEAERFILSDITLHIEKGNTIGILGGTGSAKTTLMQLIPRLYDVGNGEIRINGRNVREYPVEHLHDVVGMVLQKNTLFSGTIRRDLLWDDAQAGDVDIVRACRIACVDEFISSFPKGCGTDLRQSGVNVSSGQKQRLRITRALLKHPEVLIFDDSASTVDTATETSIREGLASLKDTAKIIIAQCVTSIQHADQIVILGGGKIHAIGTHDTLLASDPIYQDIYYSQREGAGL